MAKERYIIVTGGSSGIGLELVRRLSKKHHILTTARQISPELQELINANRKIHFASVDFSKPQSAATTMQKAIAELQWHKLDNLILNAGTGSVSDPENESAASIRDTLAINLTANIVLAHSFHLLLKSAKGQVTFIGSTAHKGAAQFASYAASKAGLNGVARSLSEEWRGQVRVQVLNLGPTQTQMHKKAGLQLGVIRNWFIPASTMAAMIDKSIAKGGTAKTLSFFQYWSGQRFWGRSL